MWQSAKVVAFVDSGLHVFPGSKLFNYFYNISSWGPGPRAQGTGIDTEAIVPDFDWRVRDVIAHEIASFDGRVSVGYLSCIDDNKVYTDRLKFATYANLDLTAEEIISHA